MRECIFENSGKLLAGISRHLHELKYAMGNVVAHPDLSSFLGEHPARVTIFKLRRTCIFHQT